MANPRGWYPTQKEEETVLRTSKLRVGGLDEFDDSDQRLLCWDRKVAQKSKDRIVIIRI